MVFLLGLQISKREKRIKDTTALEIAENETRIKFTEELLIELKENKEEIRKNREELINLTNDLIKTKKEWLSASLEVEALKAEIKSLNTSLLEIVKEKDTDRERIHKIENSIQKPGDLQCPTRQDMQSKKR